MSWLVLTRLCQKVLMSCGIDQVMSEGVDELVGIDQVMSEGVDGQSHEHASDDKGMSDNKMNSEITQFWELGSQGLVQITDGQGRLKQRLPFWREVLHAPPHILECNEHDYCLPLKFIPPPHIQHNHQSSETHQCFVDEAISSLIANHCIIRVDAQPHVCSLISVVFNAVGKLRLVLNLKCVNQFLHVLTFKSKDLRVAALMFERNEYLFKFDLKSGYHHVDIHPEFLGEGGRKNQKKKKSINK